MVVSIAHLGPTGTNAEAAALAYANWLAQYSGQEAVLCPCPSIAQSLHSVAQKEADLAVVPIENSIQGSVTMTLDTLWKLEQLKVQQALVMPIRHLLLSWVQSLEEVKIVYSHPQALAQCQSWLERSLPMVKLVPTSSTTEALRYLDQTETAAIASERAAQVYKLPILAKEITDHQDNCTRFWAVGLDRVMKQGDYISLAFSVPANLPGALVKPLSVFANRGINLSRIESRPTKRSLGEYLFFIDLEGNVADKSVQAALKELENYTRVLKIFGSYKVVPVELPEVKSI